LIKKLIKSPDSTNNSKLTQDADFISLTSAMMHGPSWGPNDFA